MRLFHLVAAILVSACGARLAPTKPDVPTDAGDSVAPPAPISTSYGTISATLSSALYESGSNEGSGYSRIFGATLYPLAPARPSACAGATVTVGACCYVPTAPPVDSGAPTLFAGESADGGPDFVMLNVGPITLQDSTSKKMLDSLQYMLIPDGFGYAEGYPDDDLGPSGWSVGDLLTVRVSGGPLGSFSAQARDVAIPDTQAPASIEPSQGLTLAWTPDPNAQTMTVALYSSSAVSPVTDSYVNHGSVTCTIADSSRTVTIAPSVLAGFPSGDTCSGWLTRTSEETVAVSGGQVTFETVGVDIFSAPVQ